MSLPDVLFSNALSLPVIKPIWFVYMDFLNDPLRANTSGMDQTVTGSGQADLDGVYGGVSHQFVEISDIKVQPGGSDTVTAKLSGIPGLDDNMRIYLAQPSNWQGRLVRMWQAIRNADNIQQGGIRHYYTGYMMSLAHEGKGDEITIRITIESYLAAFSAASNRTYQHQGEFDELDFSPKASIAIANGNKSSSLLSGASYAGEGGSFGSSGGGRDAMYNNMRDF